MPSSIDWDILLRDVVAFIVFEEVWDIKKTIDRTILVSVVRRECLKVIFEVLSERDV